MTSTAAVDAVDLGRRVTDFTTGFGRRGSYRPPTKAERDILAAGVGFLVDGKLPAAKQKFAEVDYALRTLTDTVSHRRYAEVADGAEGADGGRGWGRVYVDLSGPARFSVQVPHPVADEDSEKLGVGALRGTPGGVMVLAGAHRRAGEGNSADVAHRGDTVFDAVCAELVRHGLPGLQVHGFADATEPDYDVIVSTGKGDDGLPAARALATALEARDFDVCRTWIRRCSLEGRTNEQSGVAAAAHVPFLHVEFSRSVRGSRARTARAVAALTTVTARWSPTPTPAAAATPATAAAGTP
ncbi:hypothetical protein GA0115240_12408 [Streptomyces sp. DvalAA-14]|uniref:hypothetical protein n=1 Tax=unclassified Streptomyces TaxID=2593676 RepID=UPI00081B9BA0|nr:MULTISPECIES: hypothetical protein [unclassified Streptomyces]MYS20940.1 hypothetical protein [Streptomyces sp. SID4948]SCD80424.1 hypothetical protein GA0115240_12408 [Streptomyces sp. DvalAA-14]